MSPSHAFLSPFEGSMDPTAANMLAWESTLAGAGYRTVVGLDEVGRGALAGPIVAAAVVLPPDITRADVLWSGVTDSKTLTATKREMLAEVILEHAACTAVAALDAPIIDQIGIGPANRMVMELALRDVEATCSPDFLLIDALTIDHALPQVGIIDGDALSLSVAAASILAKVHRDAIMTSLATRWPAYAWQSNKGYGVAAHLEALRCNGPCEQHRFSFRPVQTCEAANHGEA